ncbi:sodium/proline symporter PutP [Candidatus Epulonipiscium viviparus]|uniref:sodium/proline symporter PutP n=1 Tax=Candidatus Epulonipiscium viviparus TaxID=420336 RepID=UPI002738077F|nr:sodium/proline symporter PutP [Candidatus Epulopiscium viviparus]
MDYSVIIAFVIYIAFMVAIGGYFYKKTATVNDYFLGGRKLGAWVTSMSAQASDMSGWLLMGLPGAAYFSGLSAGWIAVGLGVGTYLNWLIIAKRIRQYTKVAGDSITLPSYFTHRFRDEKGVLSMICAMFILIFFLFYTASGFVACAKLFSSVFGLSYHVSLIFGGVIIIAYTFAGGFFAVSWTDFFQGILMFFAIIIVPAVAIFELGGPVDFVSEINNINPNMFAVFKNADGSTLSFIGTISLLAWGLGYCGQPHILIRFMGISSPAEIKKSRRIATVWIIFALVAATLIGMVGRAYLTTPLDAVTSETVYIEMVSAMFPGFFGGILLCAVLASIMSTADSQLLVTASAITEDFYKFFNKDVSEKQLMWIGRGSVIVVAIVACSIAANPESSVLGLVAYAWAGFGATFGPLVVLSLFYRRTTLRGAIAGVIAGGVTTIVWQQVALAMNGVGIWGLYEIVPGFLISLAVIVIVSNLDRAPSAEILEEFDRYTLCEE